MPGALLATYKETQSNRVSDFRDFVCSLFPKAILFSSPGLCPWRAYIVTQSLAVGVRVNTIFRRLSASAQYLSFQWFVSGELRCLLTTLFTLILLFFVRKSDLTLRVTGSCGVSFSGVSKCSDFIQNCLFKQGKQINVDRMYLMHNSHVLGNNCASYYEIPCVDRFLVPLVPNFIVDIVCIILHL